MMLSISLLGSPQLLLDGQKIKISRRKSRAFLYYLAAQETSPTREHLLGFFWPDHERTAAQQLLRTTLHSLRKTLGDTLLVAEDRLGLGPEVWVDVREFEKKITIPNPDQETLKDALLLYRGDFLADFDLPDLLSFENWLTVERERYRRFVVRGYSNLARLHEAESDYRAALEAIEQALAFDPLQEDLQREALRYHYLSGDRAGAIRRYDQLRRLLDDELGVPPMAETRDLYQAIITDQLPEARPHPLPAAVPAFQEKRPRETKPTLPFTGREVELQLLQYAIRSHKLALIEGEAGIGKTRLAEEFIHQFEALPLTGAGREMGQALPYHPLIEALRSLLARPAWPGLRDQVWQELAPVWQAEVARLLPEFATKPAQPPPSPQAADEPRLWEGLHQFLVILSRQRPVLLFLDDLHWADSSTLRFLDFLIRQADDRIYYLGASRPVLPRSAFNLLLQSLTREDRIARLSLDRLEAGEVTRLSQQLCPQSAEILAGWLMRNSEGNPYVLAELVRYAVEKKILEPDGRLAESVLGDSPPLPPTIYSLIQARLASLSDPARRILDAAVAMGRKFEFDVVARAAGLSENAALDGLDEILLAGLVLPLEGLDFTFDHTLTMEVAYREVSEPRHRLLHRRIAEAMESLYSPSRLEAETGILASHYFEGNAPERSAPYAMAAGRKAMAVAGWKEAISFYEMALQGSTQSQQGEIYEALGEAYFLEGDNLHAIEAFQKAVSLAEERGDRTGTETAKLALAKTLLSQSRFEEAIQLVREVIDSEDLDRALQAEMLRGTILSIEGADLESASEHLRKAISLKTVQENPIYRSQILFELGSIAAQQGDLTKAITLYKEALEAAQEAPPELGSSFQILASNNLAYHLLLAGDPSAREYAEIGMSMALEKGAVGLQPYLYSTLGEIALAEGDLDTAERLFSQGLALAERISFPERIAGLSANLGLVAQRRGQIDRAIHRLTMAQVKADTLGTRHLAAQIRLWLAPLLPPAEGRALLSEARALSESSGRRRLLEEIHRLEKDIPPP
jgi:DNA-binding SARP family transcriptional activator